MIETHEGAKAYEHSLSHGLEFFSKAGSLFEKKGSFYGDEESALSLFQKSWIVNKELTMKLLLWLRDARGGAGNRSGTRECYRWLANHDPEWLITNITWLPFVGRWDDLRSLFDTDAEKYAVELWANAIKAKEILAAKWADRSDKPLRKAFGLSIADFRRLLAKIRKDHIVEHKMCTKRWSEIEYETVPSVAMARYTNAFGKNDEERFENYKQKLADGKTEIHADVLFPHDCVRTCREGDQAIANAQFNALPNLMEGTNEKVIVIADTSGSMSQTVGGSVRAIDVSQGLALYCSAKIPEDNPFHRKFIAFESESEFKNWSGMTFSEAIHDRNIFDRAVGATYVNKAIDLIFNTAKFFNINDDQMPTLLLIVSDMQFHKGARGSGTEIEKCLKKWDDVGYTRPKIVYWNTDGYSGSQDTANHQDIGMVSGFSPSVLKAILQGNDFSPIAIMMRALEKYVVTIP